MKKIFLIAVVTAFIIRFWHLTTLPFPPDGDEVAFGYYGWSLLHFGTDEYGNFLPTSFISIGDYKYPGLAYFNIVPAAIFGLNDLTIRFWTAIAGVALVPIGYYFSLKIFNKNIAAASTAWLLALSPWSLIESRLGYENLLSTAMTAIAVYLLLFKKESHTKTSLVLFLISSFTYAGQRILIPGLLLSSLFISFLKNSEFQNKKLPILINLIVVTLVIGVSLLFPSQRGRASEDVWKGITPEEENRLQELYVGAGISEINLPPRVTWMFHNKYKIAAINYLQNYTNHFSPEYLFFRGEPGKSGIPDMGLLLYVELLLLPIGIFTIFSRNRNSPKLVLLSWLIIAPIGSAMTIGEGHIHRSSSLLLPLALISGYGFYFLTSLNKKINKYIALLLSIGIAGSGLYTLNQILVQKPTDKPWYKEQVNKAVTLEVLSLKDKYSKVAMGDDDYIYFLFYGKISPKEFQNNSDISPINESNKWERVARLENIYFKMPYNCPKGGKLNVLYVCKGVEIPQNSNLIKVIYYKDKVPAYSLIEFYPLSELSGNLQPLPEGLHYMVDVEKSPNYPDGIIPENWETLW